MTTWNSWPLVAEACICNRQDILLYCYFHFLMLKFEYQEHGYERMMVTTRILYILNYRSKETQSLVIT